MVNCVALAQINATVGDLAGNVALASAARHAPPMRRVRGSCWRPNLRCTGYPPEDLLLRPAFMQACDAAPCVALAR
jgi:NAD+ synthase (glutamine-hydrolysing)